MATRADLEAREAEYTTVEDYTKLALEALSDPADQEYAEELLSSAEDECQMPVDYCRVAEVYAKGLGKKDPNLVPTIKFFHFFVAKLFRNAKAVQQDSCLRLGLVPVHLAEFDLQFSTANTIFFVEISLRIEGLPFGHQIGGGRDVDNDRVIAGCGHRQRFFPPVAVSDPKAYPTSF